MSKLEDLIKEAEEKVRTGEAHISEVYDANDIRELHFELTHMCNEQCIMCDIWPTYKKDPELKQKEVSSEEIIRYVEKSEYLKNLQMVLFSGGEPFLRNDLSELIGFFISKYKNISIGILSNLYATNLVISRMKQILEHKPADLWLGSSIDGLGDTHDLVRGRKGAFKTLDESLKAFRKELPQVRVVLNFTLTTENYQELEKVYAYAKEQGLSVSCQFAVPWEGARQFSWRPDQIAEVRASIYRLLDDMVQEYDKQFVVKKIDQLAGAPLRNHLLSQIFYMKGLVDYQEKPVRRFKKCLAGHRFVQMGPLGDFWYCPILKRRSIGNIRDYDYDFDKLWTSAEAGKMREFVKKGNCHCWLNCTIYPNVGEALGNSITPQKRQVLKFGWNVIQKIRGKM